MKFKNQILQLKTEGKSYQEIQQILGCSKGTISYHLGLGQKLKTKQRRNKHRLNSHPLLAKIEKFVATYENIKQTKNKSNLTKLFKSKIEDFCRDRKMGKMIYNKPTFTLEELLSKIGDNPKCYLTGETIDINQPKTYQLDHMVPRSRGGSNDLENLGICTKKANLSKSDMTLEEYLNHCKKVLETHGFKIEEKERN